MTDLILTYVPESEHLTHAEARALALKRDRQAAEQLRLSVPDNEKFSAPVLVTRMKQENRPTWTPSAGNIIISPEWGDRVKT